MAIVRTLLTGKDRGPLIYRPVLRQLGQQAALRYRAYLGLCYLWDRYDAAHGRYIQPTRPRLARDAEDRKLNAEEKIITGRDGRPVQLWTIPGRDGQRKARPGIAPLDAAGNPVALADAAQERNPAEIDELVFNDGIREAYRQALLRSELPEWFEFRRNRGTTSHTYNKEKAQEVFESAPDFPQEARYLLNRLLERNKSHD